MGRHSRSAGAPAAEDHAAGAAGRHRGRGRGRKRGIGGPVRTGLLGASAAMAMGAVAVASGLLPGGEQYTVGGGNLPGEQVRTAGAPELQQQGGSTAEPTDEAAASPSRNDDRPSTPPKSEPSTPDKPSASPSASKPAKTPESDPTRSRSQETSDSPSTSAPAPAKTTDRATPPPQTPRPPVSAPSTAEAEVLALVNEERAKAGCQPLRADKALSGLAEAFSKDMADRGFFDHTDPDGDTPWDRADQAGITNLGGENIARGQADAQAVMASWMASEGHRENILNCDYKTIGIGTHLAGGGPWWTQDFGF
ncbi:Cysteine-rich secretory protein family protein [Streptomyces sp. S4.7]|uniref:CAP domain-containing protein n=1 Tax=Streptomyces sp. S4.7 TaxID=2705439 RepID=UPI00139727D4|nr:CAP domain-containing protein [Streptomyces sp. S4.7]QHY98422.1 Cysteine-rich secretory protein family protein [Streptomyces sp. S4.7]